MLLTVKLRPWPSRRFLFDAADKRFEQSMSLRLLQAGAAVAYLPRMTFRHIGLEASAYELNHEERPWDRRQQQQ